MAQQVTGDHYFLSGRYLFKLTVRSTIRPVAQDKTLADRTPPKLNTGDKS